MGLDAVERVANRYRQGESLGRGSAGEVFAAVDEILGTEVAVKLLWDADDARFATSRHESAALRLLRVPGTTHLLDEGHHRGRRFLVMTRAKGTPFPGSPTPIPWDRLRFTVIALLETLSRVHSMGIVHGDLKPANVLVAEDGLPTVLDFGLARGPGVSARRETGGTFAGTPATMAPEAFFGAPPSPRGDLYSLGLMVYEAVTGVAAHRAPDLASLAMARGKAPPRPSSLAPGIPEEVDRFCRALLEPDPSRRPADGAAAQALLSEAASQQEEVLPVNSRDLFHGPDLILRLRERGAAELDRRTVGRPELRAAELAAWERAGLAVRVEGKWRVDLQGLDWLRLGIPVRAGCEPLPGFADRFLELARAGHDLAAAREGEATGIRLGIEEGCLADAMPLWREALAAARRAEDPAAEADLLGRLVHGSMLMQNRAWVALVAYEAERRLSEDARTRSVAILGRASWHVAEGHVDRAEEEVTTLEPFPEEHLEWGRLALWSYTVRARSAASYPGFLDAIEARWQGSETPIEIDAALLMWRGYVAYQRCHFEEAARLHQESARRTRWIPKRAIALCEAASALAERGRREEVRALLSEVQALATKSHQPELEQLILAVWRKAQVTCAELPEDDPELPEVHRHMQSATPLYELIAISEVGLLWRRGDLEGARRVLRIVTVRGMAGKTMLGGRFLPLTMALAFGEPVPGTSPHELAEAALQSPYPAMGVQALALLALHLPVVPDHWGAEAVRMRNQVPHLPGDLPREVMTLDDAMEVFAGRRKAPTSEHPWASGFPRSS